MIKEFDKIVERIISIPLTFEEKNKSASALLLDSGYLESPDSITVEVLVDALKRFPEYVDSWLMWSDNKRTDSGWFFQSRDSGIYVVGYYPRADNVASTKYTDIYVAGANFIKREIEDIRKSTF